MTQLHNRLKETCESLAVEFVQYAHESVFTAEQADGVLSHAPQCGTKSLVVATRSGLAVVTIPGNEKVQWKELKALLGDSKVSLANEEAFSQLGTQLGGVSPFGYSEGIRTCISRKLLHCEEIYFNPGRNDLTWRMTSQSFERVAGLFGVTFF